MLILMENSEQQGPYGIAHCSSLIASYGQELIGTICVDSLLIPIPYGNTHMLFISQSSLEKNWPSFMGSAARIPKETVLKIFLNTV